MAKTTYISVNSLLKAIPTDTEGLFTIHALLGGTYKTIGTIDADLGFFHPTQTDVLLRLPMIKELADFMEALQTRFK